MSGDGEYSVREGWRPRFRPDEIDKVATALNLVQGEVLKATKATANPFLKSKYADLSSVWDSVREHLTKHGLSVVQLPCEAPSGHIGLTTIILHCSGQSISEKFYMPVKDSTNPQAVGSAITYARRYALSAALGVCPEDDDGEGAKKPSVPTVSKVVSKDSSQWMYEFNTVPSVVAKKQMYTLCRNSQLQEPYKSDTLRQMAEIIKKSEDK